MCGRGDRDPPPPARPVQHRSYGDQHQHQGTSQRAPNPPPPPPLPPTSRVPPRTSQSHVQSGTQNIQLQRLSRPGPSRAGVTNRDVLEAVQAVATCLNHTNVKYAIVGGAGLAVLGSSRETDDVDFVVYPPAELKAAKNELRKDPRFTIDPRTRHTTFTGSSGSRVDIEALSSPGTFKGRFDNSTKLMTVSDEVHLLNTPLYLESKCGSLPGRTNEAKRNTDALDIRFILNFMVHSKIRTNLSEVPSATPAFIAGFEERYPGNSELFHRVGL